MNSKHTTWIICKNSKVKGTVNFYMITGGRFRFLFSQKFRHSFWEFYKNGVRFDTALDYSKARHDEAIIHVMHRLRQQINYLQRTEDMLIPEIRNKFAA